VCLYGLPIVAPEYHSNSSRLCNQKFTMSRSHFFCLWSHRR